MMRLEIAFYTEGLEFDEELAVTGPLGGSETSVGMLARALAKMGHKVRVYCNTQARGKAGKLPNGVEYCDYKLWKLMSRVMRPDVLIISRHITGLMLDPWPETGMTYLWMHDTMTRIYEKMLFSWLPAIDKIILNSKYHYHQVFKASPGLRDFEREASRQRHDLIKVMSLGLNPDDLPAFSERDHRRLLYSSRPERGLTTALDVLDRLNEKRSKLDKYTLAVGGYDVNIEMLPPSMASMYKALEKRVQQTENVEALEKRDRKSLYKEMARCQALLYPTNFEEIFCLSVLEAQACGLPVVTTQDYALRQTCPTAQWIDSYPERDDFVEKTADAIEKLEDAGHWSTVSKNGLKHVCKGGEAFAFGWDEIAKEWDTMFRQDFQNRLQRNPVGTALALYKDSDLIACQQLLMNPSDYGCSIIQEKEKAADDLLEKVTKDISFLHDPKAYIEHYATAENGRENRDVLVNRAVNQRIKTLASVIADYKDLKKDFMVLDWGANLGVFALTARDKFPDAQIVAYDVDGPLVKQAETWCKEVYKDEKKEDPDIAWISELPSTEVKFDVIVLAEVLEHVPDVKEFLEEEVFPRLTESGIMVISTPSGPWEFDSYEKDEKRFHVRRFRNIDIEDIMTQCGVLGKSLSTALHAGNGSEGDALGWLILAFEIGKKDVPKFNYRRHILTERPRETVTACIITKDRPWEIQRMIESVRPVVDEMIICDTGSTDEHAIKVTKAAADHWFKGPNPLEVGFGPARQASITPATSDWILWIDSDEWLENPGKLRKYLRENPMAGYVLFQQHLTLDGAHKDPDTPCRLFRRNGGARFIGYIHEQAEFDFDIPIAPAAPLGDIAILHDSYYNRENREERFRRNLPLLLKERKEMPRRLMTKVLLMRDFAQYGIHQINNGDTLSGMANVRQTIALYDKHFKAEPFTGKYFEVAFKFYQEALRTTGEGFGVAFTIAAVPDVSVQDREFPANMNMLVFRTIEEAQDYIRAIGLEAMEEAYRRKHGEKIFNLRPGPGTITAKSSSVDKVKR